MKKITRRYLKKNTVSIVYRMSTHDECYEDSSGADEVKLLFEMISTIKRNGDIIIRKMNLQSSEYDVVHTHISAFKARRIIGFLAKCVTSRRYRQVPIYDDVGRSFTFIMRDGQEVYCPNSYSSLLSNSAEIIEPFLENLFDAAGRGDMRKEGMEK